MRNPLDLTLLRLLKHKSHYERYSPCILPATMETHTVALLKGYGRFFRESNSEVADLDSFWPWFLLAYPNMKAGIRDLLLEVTRRAQQDVPESVRAALLDRLDDVKLASHVTSFLEKYQAGEELNLKTSISALLDSMPSNSADGIPFIPMDMEKMLDNEQDEWGFKWRLTCLNNSMRPLRPGDAGVIAARVDKGKTTWIASELSFMAPQVDQIFPGEGRHIVVFNNESSGDRINQRLVQSTLNATMPELVAMRKEGRDIWAEVKAIWGGRDVVRVLDVHDQPMSRLEDILRRANPAIVVTDMLDVVPYDGAIKNGEGRTDQVLEGAYQRARIWAVKYNCIHIAASQLRADATGELYPGDHQLANSRVGKAAAADFIATLGASSDVTLANARFVGLPKNKLHRSGFPKDPREQVQFVGERARIEDYAVMPDLFVSRTETEDII